MAFEVHADQHVEGRALVRPEGLLFDEDLADRLGLVEHPGIHGGNEGVAADEVHLKGQDAEQQIAVGARPAGGGVGHEAAPPVKGMRASLTAAEPMIYHKKKSCRRMSAQDQTES